jgi:hypothetical protein
MMKSKLERVQKLRGCGTDLAHLFRILSTMATAAYELPDTKIVDIGADRFRIPEAMFNPTIIEVTFGTSFFSHQNVLSQIRTRLRDPLGTYCHMY